MTDPDAIPERVLLIDGPGLAYRSYYAFARNPLTASSGEQTSVAFGFLRALAKVMETEKPGFWAVAFDTRVPTFRHERFGEYKANRPEMPEEMRPQMDRLREVLDALRIPMFEVEGYEADDVIATIARKAAEQCAEVVLLTEDKDFFQLVSEKVRVLSLSKGERPQLVVDEKAVVEKLGVPPRKVVDFLALVGDASDNVPGVKGVGPKTAAKLLSRYENLEDIYGNLAEISPPALRERLVQGRESAFMSRELVRLDTEAPVQFSIEQMRRVRPDEGKLRGLMRELEFTRLADAFLSDWEKSREERDEDRHPASLRELLRDAAATELWSFALGRDARGRLCVAVCGEGASGVYEAEEGHDRRSLEEFLGSERYRKCAHDLKSEFHLALGAGLKLGGAVGDCMLASYLLAPEGGHDIAAIAARHADELPRPDGGVKDRMLWRARVARTAEKRLAPKVARAGMDSLYREVEIPLAFVLARMERCGFALDTDALRSLSKRLDELIARSEEDIYCMAGTTFNINSPRQLASVLFERLGLPPGRRTKTGYSTDSSVLEELAADYELPREILNYRQLVKLKSTYVDPLPRLVDPETGRIHATFHQTGTATGRLSSSNPNMQNIPIRGELGAQVRRAFVAGKPGHVLLTADYSQIELRIMAHLSGDRSLIDSFETGIDPHAATASVVFGVPVGRVDGRLRDKAKTVNYGVMYGMGASGLARRLGISRKEAEDFIRQYFEKMPQVKSFIEQLIESARRSGVARTIMNRVRPLPSIASSDRRARAQAERMAVNTPIQGSAADIIKKAMVDVSRKMDELGLAADMILQVHDELVFEVSRDCAERLRSVVVEAMENAVELSVPLKVAVGVGSNWMEAHPR